MSTYVATEFKTQPGRAEELVAALRQALPDSLAHDGCEAISLRRNQDDPTNIVSLTQWAVAVTTRNTLHGEPKPASPTNSVPCLSRPCPSGTSMRSSALADSARQQAERTPAVPSPLTSAPGQKPVEVRRYQRPELRVSSNRANHCTGHSLAGARR
jgi:hypothetical protein